MADSFSPMPDPHFGKNGEWLIFQGTKRCLFPGSIKAYETHLQHYYGSARFWKRTQENKKARASGRVDEFKKKEGHHERQDVLVRAKPKTPASYQESQRSASGSSWVNNCTELNPIEKQRKFLSSRPLSLHTTHFTSIVKKRGRRIKHLACARRLLFTWGLSETVSPTISLSGVYLSFSPFTHEWK